MLWGFKYILTQSLKRENTHKKYISIYIITNIYVYQIYINNKQISVNKKNCNTVVTITNK